MRRHIGLLALAIAAAGVVLHTWYLHPWLLDDAFICFRYAQHLVQGQGLVFNPGERVEGYTCFLWVLLLAGPRALGADLVLTSQALGLACSLGTLVLLAGSGRWLRPLPTQAPALAVVLLGTCGAFTAWAASGMEVALFSFLLLLAVLLYGWAQQAGGGRRLALPGLALALLAMTRPEGLLVAAVLCADQVATRRRGDSLYLLLTLLGLFGAYYAWRFAYYGYPWPNTYYAKVGYTLDQVARGLRYGGDFAAASAGLLLPLAAGVLSPGWWRRNHPLHLVPPIVLLYSGYVVMVGGDCMPAFRFFAPLLPLVCLGAAYQVLSLGVRPQVLAGAIAIMVAFNLCQYQASPELRRAKNDQVAYWGKEVGLWLRQHARPGALLAANTAGSVPYYSQLRTIDMLGLNDLHIAHRRLPALGRGASGHEKGDGAYVLSRRPDYIQFASSLGSIWPVFPGDRELDASPEFRRCYLLRAYRLPSGRVLYLYQRRPAAPGWPPGRGETHPRQP